MAGFGVDRGSGSSSGTPEPSIAESLIDAKGDLIAGTAANTANRLAVGANETRLVADSGELTGLKYVADTVNYLITAAGGTIEGTGAGVVAEKPASATVAAHATTCDVWSARETILSGAAVTFTDLPLGDYVGQVAWVRMNAAHIWTQGAVFTVQGGATYTTAANDWLRIEAITVSTFSVTIFPASGLAVAASATQAEQETGTDLTKTVTPGRQQFHQSAAKAWGTADGAGTIQVSFNVASTTDTAVGDMLFNFTTSFSGADVCFVVSAQIDTGATAATTYAQNVMNTSTGTSSVRIRNARVSDGALTDPNRFIFSAFGDQ